MAKAQQVIQRPEMADPQVWLADVLRMRFAEMLSKREIALDPARIDGIHDMRVAIRRLRSVIRDFAEFAEKFPLKEIRKDLKRLAGTLGAVRDADVAIRALDKFAAKASKEPVLNGISLIADRRRGARSRAFKALKPHLAPKAIDTLSQHFETALESSLAQRSLFEAADLETAARRIIANRIDDFHRLADSLYDPFRIRRLHRLRLAAKHLRYAVELFARDSKDGRHDFAAPIAKMQGRLGDVHDCDAWIAELQTGLKAKKQKALTGPERLASAWLLSQFVRRRDKAYRAALALWVEWEETALLDRLREWPPPGSKFQL